MFIYGIVFGNILSKTTGCKFPSSRINLLKYYLFNMQHITFVNSMKFITYINLMFAGKKQKTGKKKVMEFHLRYMRKFKCY